jgi:hypothetical protein
MPALTNRDFTPRTPSITHVPIPECGMDAYACIRPLGAKDLQALRAKHGADVDTENRPQVFDILARSLCDESGALLFADAAACQDAFDLSLPALEALVRAISKHSGLTEKNSPPPSSISSPSLNGSAIGTPTTSSRT